MAPAPDDLLGLVATGIAHEVRNPLNALRLNLRILEDELRVLRPESSTPLLAVLERIAAEVGQIDHFVSDFLRYARPVRLVREALALQPLVTDLIAFARAHAARAGVRVEVRGSTGALVEADGVQLRQALFAVAANAIDVTPRGATVVLEVSDRPATIAIDLHDGAPALSADAIARAYQPFVAGRDGTTALPLAIARRIVEAHGGTLTMDSVPDRGNCATMTLVAQRRPT